MLNIGWKVLCGCLAIRRHAALLLVMTLPSLVWAAGETVGADSATASPVALSEEHLAAVARQRRIYVNNDVGYGLPMGPAASDLSPKEWIAARFSIFSQPGCQVDSVGWSLDEGNIAAYSSKVIPELQYPTLLRWRQEGVDILKLLIEESRRHKIEAFFEYRLNGADRETDISTPARIPLKDQHPEWLIEGGWWKPGLWNFTVPEVRKHKVDILREVVERYDFDGISLDFGRHPPFLPLGQQWLHRDAMTDFMRQVRLMLQDVAQRRGHPLLLAVRVPQTPAGCHFDGLDVETWVRQNLVDIIILGVRSTDPDVFGFRRITTGTHVRLYPCIDDIHATDGYLGAPIEFFRGLAANWRRQGVDGIATFNFCNETPETASRLGRNAYEPLHRVASDPHRQAYHEIGDPKSIQFKDKLFTLQRRFGAGWEPPMEQMYQNLNVEAPLPAVLQGPAGTPFVRSIYIGDDVAGNRDRVAHCELRLLLSGATDKPLNLKFNGISLVDPVRQENGWQTFKLSPRCFAVGPNLVSAYLSHPPATGEKVQIEKLEISLRYRSP